VSKKEKDDSDTMLEPTMIAGDPEKDVGLSEDEKKAIEKVVEKELLAADKHKQRADYKAKVVAEKKRKKLFRDAKPGEAKDGLVPIFVDLPSVSECIRIDGTAFYPGRTYNVRPPVRELILEMMGRGLDHEHSLNGKTAVENRFRQKGMSPAITF